MTRTMLLALALLGVGPRDLAAQWNLARLQPGDAQLHLTMAIDPAVITSLGYGRFTSLLGATARFGVEAGVVAGDAELRDFRVRLSGDVQLMQRGAFRLVASATFITRGTRNTSFRAVNFGSDIGATAGVYRRGWFVAGEIGFDKAIITHLTHTQEYRDQYYADARDGWYLNNGGTGRLGLMTGTSLGAAELMLRAGVGRTQGGEPLTAPAYLTVGVGFGFE
ncbi:MAG: hypothetical protein IPP98_06065 [Gemmatimonadetes bacterium]|nr:hypothetical protein [Gemmatimonadota bacterium]